MPKIGLKNILREEMKEILIESVNISGGGSLQVALSIIQNASKQRSYSWSLAISEDIARQLDEKVKSNFKNIFVFKNHSFLVKFLNIFKIKEIIGRLNPDLVFTIFGPAYWKSNIKHLQGFALPLLIYPFNEWNNPNNKFESIKQFIISFFKGKFIRRDCFYVVETETVKERLSSFFAIQKENIFVVQNSFSPIFQESLKKSLFETKRKRNKIFNIFIPSSYYGHKNLEIVPFVASEMKKNKFKAFAFTFIISEKSQGWKNIRKIAKQLNVQEEIRTIGPVKHNEMASLYLDCDLVLLPTLAEASTAVYPESFQAKKILLTSSRLFAKELCQDGAVYVDPRNSSEIASNIFEISRNKQMKNIIIGRARKVLNENYPTPQKKWKLQYDIIKKLTNN